MRMKKKQIPNTFGLEVRAENWLEYHSVEELEGFIAQGLVGTPCLHVGRGSNLLFLHDYEGTVLHSCIRTVEVTAEDENRVDVRVGAGMVWDDFVDFCIAKGWYGAENLSGIPGEVGAAAVQNIGAYGVEVKDLICSVETINRQGEKQVFPKQSCHYAYRDSLFKQPAMKSTFVTHVRFRLAKQERYALDYGALCRELQGEKSLEAVRRAVLAIRSRKLPDPAVLGNAGSFFKNPVVSRGQFEALAQAWPGMPHYPAEDGGVKLSAGWLIEQCGWKGRRRGAAGVYDKQALVLVNAGGATGRDILELAQAIKAEVHGRFGVALVPEVNFIG